MCFCMIIWIQIFKKRCSPSLSGFTRKKIYEYWDSVGTPSFAGYKKSASKKQRNKMKKLLQKSLWRAFLLYIYAVLGGCMFYLLERKPEKNREVYFRLSRELQENFTAQFNISINESDFKRFMQKAFEVVRVGSKADWSILSGLSFSMTTLATVGELHTCNLRQGYAMLSYLTPCIGFQYPIYCACQSHANSAQSAVSCFATSNHL